MAEDTMFWVDLNPGHNQYTLFPDREGVHEITITDISDLKTLEWILSHPLTVQHFIRLVRESLDFMGVVIPEE